MFELHVFVFCFREENKLTAPGNLLYTLMFYKWLHINVIQTTARVKHFNECLHKCSHCIYPVFDYCLSFVLFSPALSFCLPVFSCFFLSSPPHSAADNCRDLLVMLTWPQLTLVLCYSKLILLIRAQSETKTKETYCVLMLLALQSLGTSDVCRSHTKLGMVLITLKEQRSENTWTYLCGLIMPHKTVVMIQTHLY